MLEDLILAFFGLFCIGMIIKIVPPAIKFLNDFADKD